MNISENKVVQIQYSLKNGVGQVLECSEENAPLTFIQGKEGIIVGLEESLEGKAAGDKIETIVAPDKGYGLRSEEKLHTVPASSFEADGDERLVEGMQVRVDTGKGIVLADVTKIDGENATLDLNHPFAGETLYFTVEVVSVREATKQELNDGQVCGSSCGCC
ncbi:MAG: FKBP-type peptidyl-prolyl cis-trans isomerase SlyD [Bacteroidia bacterium]|jgi:FKBP-type peptidyl-prolyl cis-trans isomerase SlyD